MEVRSRQVPVHAAGRAAPSPPSSVQQRPRGRCLEGVRGSRGEASGHLRRLAEGVARSLGSPLAVIMGNADMVLSGEAEGQDEVASALRTIRGQAERVQRLAHDLLLYAKPGEPVLEPVDLCQVAEEALRRAVGPGAPPGLRTSLLCESRSEATALADRAHVAEALYRVLQNATHSMPRGGELSVNVARRPPPREAEAGEVPWVRTLVRDEGAGISAEDLAHVFEPFFTTRPWADGLGLGLPVASTLVRLSGGVIDVRSRVDEGTEVRIYLPPG